MKISNYTYTHRRTGNCLPRSGGGGGWIKGWRKGSAQKLLKENCLNFSRCPKKSESPKYLERLQLLSSPPPQPPRAVCLCIYTLHAAAEPAVRSAVKILVSQRNDTITAFFFTAKKITTVHKLLWSLLVVNSSIPGLI